MSPSVPGPRRASGRGGRAFAVTWWGRAWVAALEDSALDAARLSRGRTYARQGMVGPVAFAPGRVEAAVQGSRYRPYRSSVHLPVLTDDQWGTLLGAVEAQAGHIAALLDGEMPAELVDDARTAGVPLLPMPTELEPDCSCPDWGHPCKHAAALCYAVAAAVDDDPFALFALRGRDREEILALLRTRRAAARDTTTARAPAGVPAAAAYAAWAARTEPPSPPEPPGPAPHAAALPIAPPSGAGFTTADLEHLMADTAARAAGLLAGDTTSLFLTREQDALRIAASGPGPEWFHHLVRNTGADPIAFARLTRAWRHGGPVGATVAERPHTPGPTVMAAARTALAEALVEMTDAPAPIRTWRNRLTLTGHGIQLRLGPDTRWYPYVQDGGAWWPAAPACADPVTALTEVWQRAGK
ncbi:SWIM zinc finger family protein [Streptomyces mangrovi]|uniref:SWIM zinc finger family protein n=1 Tax=Streptomyces mangrovi TaxID=1206892 RepID=UPI00399D2004